MNRLLTIYIPHGWKQSATDWLDKRGFDLRRMDVRVRQKFTEGWIWG